MFYDSEKKGLAQPVGKPLPDLQGNWISLQQMMKVKETLDRRGSWTLKCTFQEPDHARQHLLWFSKSHPDLLSNPRAKWQELRSRASDLLDLGSTEAPRWGWQPSRSHWHSGARHFPTSPATATSTWQHGVPPHSPGTESVPISTGAALLRAIRQRKAIYYRWKLCVLKHAA